MNLLIADDELVIRKGLLSLDWESIGISEVYSAGNGEEVKNLLLSAPIDLAIFDIKMPGMTGLELAAMIREYSLDTAVILLTGFSDFEYAIEALRNQVYEYILKPFRPREMLDVVEKVKRRLEEKRYQSMVVHKYEQNLDSSDVLTQLQSSFPKVSEITSQLLQNIADHYTEQIKLEELAEQYHFSASYLSRKVKNDTGYSFQDILKAVRLTNAIRYLFEGDKVWMACEKSGFRDQRYFSQVFRVVFDVSPTLLVKTMDSNHPSLKFFAILDVLVRKKETADEE